MKMNQNHKQKLAVLLTVTMLLSSGAAPTPALAKNTEDTQDILYDIHREHLEEGIYVTGGECSHRHTSDCYELVEDCIHVHTEDCYSADKPAANTSSNASLQTSSNAVSEDDPDADTELINDLEEKPEGCTHSCSVKSGCVVKKLICEHADGEHDESCGYSATSSNLLGTSSNSECPLCVIQLRIDKLPDTETFDEMSENEYAQLYAELISIWEAIEKLTDKEQTLINRTRLDMWIEMVGGIAAVAANVIQHKDTPEEWIGKYTVDGISPGNVTINLFDYWPSSINAVDAKSYKKARSSFFTDDSINADAQKNIHPFLFAGIGANFAYRFGSGYNTYTGGTNPDGTKRLGGVYSGIVRSTLDKQGYPVLNLTAEQIEESFALPQTTDSQIIKNSKLPDGFQTPSNSSSNESLAYLFNPEIEHGGKASYGNVRGLLQRDKHGYYYYDSTLNFAEFNEDKNEFLLFGQSALPGSKTKGEFFPFNTGADVFDEENDSLVPSKTITKYDNDNINHYFGLTLNVNFYQPDGGKIEVAGQTDKQPMQFEFSGDDDVWVFIDGVLVADLGGIHDTYEFTIDFSNGKVTYGGGTNMSNTTIREQFLNAIDDNGGTLNDSQGNEITSATIDRYFRKTDGDDKEAGTFRSGTEHTLQLFYLERGNEESNLKLMYNLVPPIADDVVKLDQDNKPIKDVEFRLYASDENYTKRELVTEEPWITDENGTKSMLDEFGIPYDFRKYYEDNNWEYYILHEVEAPKGYRKVPDIHLKYDPTYNILTVTNHWDTGAVGNFNANVYQFGDLKYQNKDNGATIPSDIAQKGIVLAVPLIKRGNSTSTIFENWQPIYGGNLDGFSVARDSDDSKLSPEEKIRKRVLRGALYQIHANHANPKSYPSWNLAWSADESRFQGKLMDLPGTPDRYYHTANDADDPNIDLAMSYYFVDGSVFGNNAGMSSEDKLQYLESRILFYLGDTTGMDHTSDAYYGKLNAAIDEVIKENDNYLFENFNQINPEEFKRIYGSHIYVPNALNSLYVLKQDEEGNALEGVEFGLYTDENGVKKLQASGKTGKDGRIQFSAEATPSNSSGTTYVQFPLIDKSVADPAAESAPDYFLHEIATLDGYRANDAWVPIYITANGVYASAGSKNDNISVYSGLGKLLGTMTRFADGAGINVTLRDITLTGGPNTVAQNGEKTLDVHYGLPGALLDYGTHPDANGKTILPLFITEAGDAYGEAYQNYGAHQDKNDEFYSPYAHKEELVDDNGKQIELSNLFTGSTTVVVRNIKEGRLTVDKTVGGNAGDKDKAFTFTVTLDDSSVKGTYGDMEFENGVANFTLKHGESKTASGLPFNVHYTVTEKEANADGYITTASPSNTDGMISEEDSYVSFLNVKNTTPPDPGKDPDPKTGFLTVSKTVTGSRGDTTRDFTFTATLSDASINGTYGDMTFQDGVAVFTLKRGESKTASGLPYGIHYTVGESNNSGYRVTSSGAEGTIPEGGTAVVHFNNHRSGGGGNDPGDPGNPSNPGTPGTPGTPETAEPPSDPARPLLPMAPGETPETAQNPPFGIPRTGDETRLALWLALAGISAAGLAIILAVFRRRRREDEE